MYPFRSYIIVYIILYPIPLQFARKMKLEKSGNSGTDRRACLKTPDGSLLILNGMSV